jgi:hypothetical protein
MSNENTTTPFEVKCEIVAELWMDHRNEKAFEDFVQYNDIGLPLAFMIAEDLVTPSERARAMVEETFTILLATLEVEDTGFESLDDLLVG